ncbi:DUF4383 domain-containing protein [Streptomyces xantholiticus]
MTTNVRAAHRTSRRRTPAQWYLLVSGVFVTLWGIAGFFVNSSFTSGVHAVHAPGNHGLILGVFATNGWHNVVALTLGGVALLLHGSSAVKGHAAGLGAGYLAFTVSTAMAGHFLLAGNLANDIVHVLLAVTGIGAAIVTRASRAD